MNLDNMIMTITDSKIKNLKGGIHISRTMMFEELAALLEYVNNPNAPRSEYEKGVCDHNCLGKLTLSNRKKTFHFLVSNYILSPDNPLFRAFLFFWNHSSEAREQLAFLFTVSRDSILRLAVPFIRQTSPGNEVKRIDLENWLETQLPNHFQKSTLTAIAQRINGSMTTAGYLTGKTRKIRQQLKPTPSSVAFALYLGYRMGLRGKDLFVSPYVQILDCLPGQALRLAEIASVKGLISLRHLDEIIEVSFPVPLCICEGRENEQTRQIA